MRKSAAAAVLAALAWSPSSSADETSQTVAQQLFEDGSELLEAGR